MYDFHTHSNFSTDSKSSMDSICISAIEKNLKGICFTDHIDLNVTKDNLNLEFIISDYLKNIKTLKFRYNEQLEIYKGIEIGMQAHLFERYDHIIKSSEFDFVIMSIHVLGDKSEFIDEFLSNMNPTEALTQYYNTMYKCVKSFDNYDVLGHVDFIDRYFKDPLDIPKYDRFLPIIEDILKIIIQKEKGIEINTASLRYGLDYLHPKPSILKLYKDLGGEIITIGSDAHRSEFIGSDFEIAKNTLKNLGFKKIYIFKDRKKLHINL